MKNISLVLLPGLDGTGELFDPLIAHLPNWINPIVVPYPKDKPYGYSELKPIVNGKLPENSDFVIIGESFSGPLAVMTASDHPKGLQGIILCASFIIKPFRFVPSWLSIFSFSAVYQLWPVAIRLRTIVGRENYRQLAVKALDAIKSVGPDVIAARVKAILKVNVEEELGRCDVPILYMAGGKDHLIKKHNIDSIKKIKPDIKVSEIGTQHLILQLEPKIAAEEIEKFLKSI
jgi:pimeloyl-ACP methyl ester carboxylesterase